MKTDLYTKTVLTVIAACLLWLCVAGTPAALMAQPQMRKPPAGQTVYIAGITDFRGTQIPFNDNSGNQVSLPVVGR